MERFAMYEGVSGFLVSDPETLPARRFVGMQLDPALESEPEFCHRFKPWRQVRKVSHDLQHAVKKHTLKQIGNVVVAKDHESAELLILAQLEKGHAKPKKGDS